MTLNKKKCVIVVEEVEFLGFKVGKDGINVGPKIQGIVDFQLPKDVKAVRSFIGMVNQYSRFNSKISSTSAALRYLLKKNIPWIWDKAQEESFDKLKNDLKETVTLAYFDINKNTILTTDASDYRAGEVLSQEDKDGMRRMIGAASLLFTETEKRYATIEKEALAVVCGLEKFHYHICGAPILVETDHKPLISLLGNKEIENVPIIIQRYRIGLMKYAVEMKHISGKDNISADALSRYPNKDVENTILQIEVEEMVSHSFLPEESTQINRIRNMQ